MREKLSHQEALDKRIFVGMLQNDLYLLIRRIREVTTGLQCAQQIEEHLIPALEKLAPMDSEPEVIDGERMPRNLQELWDYLDAHMNEQFARGGYNEYIAEEE